MMCFYSVLRAGYAFICVEEGDIQLLNHYLESLPVGCIISNVAISFEKIVLHREINILDENVKIWNTRK